jgi:hypothetical protein
MISISRMQADELLVGAAAIGVRQSLRMRLGGDG